MIGLAEVSLVTAAGDVYLVEVTGRDMTGRFVVTDITGDDRQELHTFTSVPHDEAQQPRVFQWQWRAPATGLRQLLLSGEGTITSPTLTVTSLSRQGAAAVGTGQA